MSDVYRWKRSQREDYEDRNGLGFWETLRETSDRWDLNRDTGRGGISVPHRGGFIFLNCSSGEGQNDCMSDVAGLETD